MAYIGNTPGVSSQRVVLEEVISGAPKSAFTPISGYTLGYVDVLVNGVEIDSNEFTAPDGVTVTLTSAAQIGDTVKIKTWLPRGLSDGYLKSEADARFLNLAGGTLTGRLGVGVAPAAWQSGTGVIDLGNTSLNSITSAVGTAAGNALIANNAYFDGTNWKYKFGYYATMYSTGDGLHQWKYAASGAAGANISFIEALRIETTGALGLTSGQIKFPATQNPSSDANTLDDYEEGTWTPTVTAAVSNPTVTYSKQEGTYVKVGKNVFFTCDVRWSSLSGGSGNVNVSGLPFTTAFPYSGGIVAEKSGANLSASGNILTVETNSSATSLVFLQTLQTGGSGGYLVGNLSASGYLIFSMTYISAA